MRSVRRYLKSFAACLAVACSVNSSADPLTGKVVGVTDGDTLTVLVDRQPIRVRFAEIDTPERGQPGQTGRSRRCRTRCSARSSSFRSWIPIATAAQWPRSTGTAATSTGRWYGRGQAWVYRKDMRDPSLLEDERKAREAEAGLWALPEAQRVPPWEWRHGGVAQEPDPEVRRLTPAVPFTCSAKRYCREMTSCEEVRFYLERCGLSRLDGDGDGVPCEALCR